MVQPFAWGSHSVIAELQGRQAPTAAPEAELWMGAHPSGPSGLCRNGARTTLDAVVAADPEGELGSGLAGRFGGRLPFLLKVLAIEKALSIQVHPSRPQAEAGYRAENERGLAPDDKARNYVDDWPKPEMLCALTPVEALAGMRTPQDAAALIRALDVAVLVPLADSLDAGAGPAALTAALAEILAWPAESRSDVVMAVAAGCARVAASDGPYTAACAAYAKVSVDHPGDLGLIAALLLKYTVLAPGQAVYLPADGLHCYLRGAGVEIMSSSDNVLRAGLTPKHIDIPELLKLTDPAAAVPVIEPTELGEGVTVYETPAPEFRLYRAELGPGEVTLPGDGPRVLRCTEGTGTLRSVNAGAGAGAAELKVAKGESCFLSAADGEVRAVGPVTLFVACAGLAE